MVHHLVALNAHSNDGKMFKKAVRWRGNQNLKRDFLFVKHFKDFVGISRKMTILNRFLHRIAL